MKDIFIEKKFVLHDGNSAAAYIAYALSEVVAIYPITPSSPMSEIADKNSFLGKKNIWGNVPKVIEMQSESGAAGAVHGALVAGSMATTFTSSQGLLLMIPSMYKIAGELLPTVFHVAARSIATHALSIFCDHSDVMAVRSTGFAIIASNSAQEALDMALVAHVSTLRSRVPFVHFFDGFRTSHEIQKIENIPHENIKNFLDEELVFLHRARGLSPNRPSIKGTAQNPDVFFQSRERVSSFYLEVPSIVKQAMDKIYAATGRKYNLFDYVGSPVAEAIIVIMGSAADTAQESVEDALLRGLKVGLIKVRLFRPFSVKDIISVIPKTVKKIAVLDRTKEPGASGEPLYLDVKSAAYDAAANGFFENNSIPLVIKGRYGLGSKEFTPSMAKSVIDNLFSSNINKDFTVGILDDVLNTNLSTTSYEILNSDSETYEAMFYGLGGDGTVSANKNSIKIINEATDLYSQGYFVYDSKKAGALTVSHLRFGKKPILKPYLINRADFLASHSFSFLQKFNLIEKIKNNGVLLINTLEQRDKVWDALPLEAQEGIIRKKIKLFAIDANAISKASGLGGKINVVMQKAFFIISKIIDADKVSKMMIDAIKKSYFNKGNDVIESNIKAILSTDKNICEISNFSKLNHKLKIKSEIDNGNSQFEKEVISKLIFQKGNDLSVSALPCDGTYPTGTAKYEKRCMASEIPIWNDGACLQCNQCSFVCPHSAIRAKIYNPTHAATGEPDGWQFSKAKGANFENMLYTLQVAPEDCTGCGNCVHVCPAYVKDVNGKKTTEKALRMVDISLALFAEKEKWNHFTTIPDIKCSDLNIFSVKESQLLPTMFEFSGACAGCGETPYIKLLTQLYGDRLLIANATGCSSIYGGNLPTTPYTTRQDGKGPAWVNSLFEDNAEFGLGMSLSVENLRNVAKSYLLNSSIKLDKGLIEEVLNFSSRESADIETQRLKIDKLKAEIRSANIYEKNKVANILDYLVPLSIWIIGGDGWAYDIGYGGVDHVLASGKNVNILVLDTGVYSNTGGQASKSTPIGAYAKFASGGKELPRKDLGIRAIISRGAYVAQVAYGANMSQLIKSLKEAELFDGPSIVIAYSHCIEHGIDMTKATDLHKKAEKSGFWPLYRFNPSLKEKGKNPLALDSDLKSNNIEEFVKHQNRFKFLNQGDSSEALVKSLKEDVRYKNGILGAIHDFYK